MDEAPRLLRVADPRAAEVIAGVFRREGVDVRTGTPVTNAERDGDEVRLSLASGEAVRAERVLVGPRP